MAIPATIAYFVTYEQLRVLLHDEYIRRTGELTQPIWIPLVAGAVGRTWAVTMVNPLELLRTKMQSKSISYKGKYHNPSISQIELIRCDVLFVKSKVDSIPFTELSAACRSLVEARGILGFWMGWAPTILRDVPFSGKYFI